MGYREVMSMPMRAFWIVSGFVDRLMSDEAKLHLEVAASAQNGEAAGQLMERLNTNLAEVTGLVADDPGKVGQALHDARLMHG